MRLFAHVSYPRELWSFLLPNGRLVINRSQNYLNLVLVVRFLLPLFIRPELWSLGALEGLQGLLRPLLRELSPNFLPAPVSREERLFAFPKQLPSSLVFPPATRPVTLFHLFPASTQTTSSPVPLLFCFWHPPCPHRSFRLVTRVRSGLSPCPLKLVVFQLERSCPITCPV